MRKFLFGRDYIIEKTDTKLTAFELVRRDSDFLTVYVREYVPSTNELTGYELTIPVLNDGFEEFVTIFKKDITAIEHYEGKICIYTREGFGTI